MKLKKKEYDFLEEDFLVCFQAGKGLNTAGEGDITAGYGNKKGRKATTRRQVYESKIDF